jgi:hypothetical protein
MQGDHFKMESLPARESREEAQAEAERLNQLLEKPKHRWDGSCRERYWVKEIV